MKWAAAKATAFFIFYMAKRGKKTRKNLENENAKRYN